MNIAMMRARMSHHLYSIVAKYIFPATCFVKVMYVPLIQQTHMIYMTMLCAPSLNVMHMSGKSFEGHY